jgi:hypothetical protein
MSVVTEERVERALDIATMIIVREYFGVDTSANDIAVDAYVSCEALATDILAAVAPIIAKAERERCARVADRRAADMWEIAATARDEGDQERCERMTYRGNGANSAAAAIRALGDAT